MAHGESKEHRERVESGAKARGRAAQTRGAPEADPGRAREGRVAPPLGTGRLRSVSASRL